MSLQIISDGLHYLEKVPCNSGTFLTFTLKNAEMFGVNLISRCWFTRDEEIKEGDSILYGNRIGTYKYDSIVNTHDVVTSIGTFPFQTKEYFKKIIATTDKSLGLPSPSDGFIKKFIEKYNAGTPITEIMVEYDESTPSFGTCLHLHVDKNNCITIRPVKESWTREEVIAFAKKYAKRAQATINPGNKWIEENL